ncbi:unnamed protein product [Lactuca virosa]|uniref:Uncharacterized protein n=1 Tax=Lactuca virosa TaxID=75947 RepID=A0AAU9M109_9ASTR|nr:unnamed protein product [Lactuca virosa]
MVTLHGRFEILMFSGTVHPPLAPPNVGGLSLFLVSRGGKVMGRILISYFKSDGSCGVIGDLIAENMKVKVQKPRRCQSDTIECISEIKEGVFRLEKKVEGCGSSMV